MVLARSSRVVTTSHIDPIASLACLQVIIIFNFCLCSYYVNLHHVLYSCDIS